MNARLTANGVCTIEQVFQGAVVVWPSSLTDIGAAAASLTCFCNIGTTGPDGGPLVRQTPLRLQGARVVFATLASGGLTEACVLCAWRESIKK